MTIHAFVISTPEEEVVNALSRKGSLPAMDGSLFKFKSDNIEPFINKIGQYANKQEFGSEGWHVAMRLQERLGTWLGRQAAEAKQDEAEQPAFEFEAQASEATDKDPVAVDTTPE